jgi:hypothetical protein
MKDEQMLVLLNKFAEQQTSKGGERMTRKSKEFEENRDNTTSRRVDYRQVCIENHLDVWGGSEVKEKIDKLVALGYYTRKPLKPRDLKAVKLTEMNDAAGYAYYVKEETTVNSHGTASSSSYSVERDLKDVPIEEVDGLNKHLEIHTCKAIWHCQGPQLTSSSPLM